MRAEAVNPSETSWLGNLPSVNDLRRLIDPGDAWQLRRDGWMADEALRVRGIRGV